MIFFKRAKKISGAQSQPDACHRNGPMLRMRTPPLGWMRCGAAKAVTVPEHPSTSERSESIISKASQPSSSRTTSLPATGGLSLSAAPPLADLLARKPVAVAVGPGLWCSAPHRIGAGRRQFGPRSGGEAAAEGPTASSTVLLLTLWKPQQTAVHDSERLGLGLGLG